MDIAGFLQENDERYDEAVRLPWSLSRSSGYHTRVPAGTKVHETLRAADYAIGLLTDGSAPRVDRAHDVLDALMDLQTTDPTAAHFGLTGYFREEPAEQMAPADWNWADFIGIRLAQVLALHREKLRPEVLDRLRATLRNCALAVFRRNVGPVYTNIALMGAVTVAAAGEQLAVPYLLDYGRRRITAVNDLVAADGGFAEYNSPTYSPLLLTIIEVSAQIVADEAFGGQAERLRVMVWEALSERFHPGTGQLAGPQARAYTDRLRPGTARFLAERTGAPIVAHPRAEGVEEMHFAPALPCPAHVVERFQDRPAVPRIVRTRFSEGPRGDVIGTTWLAGDACLGSANVEFGWVQRRPLLGYWRTPRDPAVVLRGRLMLNGHDLTAAWCRQEQDGPRVLSAWWLTYDSGDFHPNLDKPEASVFDVGEMSLRVTLAGDGVSAKDLGAGVFELSAGEYRAVVHTAPVSFLGTEYQWRLADESVEADGEVAVEAVLHTGPPEKIDFHDAVLRAAFALQVVSDSADADDSTLSYAESADGAEIRWQWSDLAVAVPARPTPFQ